jgi:hypothetical protein
MDALKVAALGLGSNKATETQTQNITRTANNKVFLLSAATKNPASNRCCGS